MKRKNCEKENIQTSLHLLTSWLFMVSSFAMYKTFDQNGFM